MSDAPDRRPTGLCNQLRRFIAESGLTMRQIAQEADVAHTVVSRFAKGDRDVSLASAERIARALSLKLVESAGRRRRRP